MIKYYKYGFGRVSDYVNEAIRAKTMTRDAGIQLVTQYDSSCDSKYIKAFCNYIGISAEDFWSQVTNSANRDLFHVSNDGRLYQSLK